MNRYPRIALGELASGEPGAIAIGPFGSRMKAEVYVDYGVPVIRGKNISGGRSLRGEWVYVSENFAKEIPNCIVKEGDLVFPHRGAIGEIAIISGGLGDMVLSTSMMKFRPDKSRADSAFLYYFFRSSDGRAEILKFASQVGTPGIGQPLTSLRQFRVPLPSLNVQKKVASILGSLDDKIDLNQEMNRTLEAIARAIFKAWFVDFEPVKAKAAGATHFPGMPQKAFDALPDQIVDSALGPLPAVWDVVPFSRLVQLLGGGTPKRKIASYWNGDIPWFSVRDAPDPGDVWVIDTEENITQEGVEDSAAKPMRAGTTIISARGTVGRLALTAVPMAMNQSCYGVQGADGVGDFFVYFSLHHAVSELQQRSHGSVFDTITRNSFDTLPGVKPQREVLAAFEVTVSPYLQLIRNNRFENRTLASIRDALLPKVISGEIAVSSS